MNKEKGCFQNLGVEGRKVGLGKEEGACVQGKKLIFFDVKLSPIPPLTKAHTLFSFISKTPTFQHATRSTRYYPLSTCFIVDKYENNFNSNISFFFFYAVKPTINLNLNQVLVPMPHLIMLEMLQSNCTSNIQQQKNAHQIYRYVRIKIYVTFLLIFFIALVILFYILLFSLVYYGGQNLKTSCR